MVERKGCIYVITNLLNGKQYVGQTIDFKRRWWQHCHPSYEEDQAINKAIQKYGKKKFECKIVHDDIPESKLNDWEKYYINEVYNTYKGYGYNCHIGGSDTRGINNPMYGGNFSKEHRRKISEANTGKKNGFYGKNHTQETKKIISQKAKGREYSEESIKKQIETKKKNKSFSFMTIELAEKVIKKYTTTNSTQQEIANYYELGYKTVSRILNNKHWICDFIEIDFDEIENKRISNYSGLNNSNAKITIKDAIDIIKKYYLKGMSGTEIAKKYPVKSGVIYSIKNGEHWTIKHIKENNPDVYQLLIS